MGFGTIFFIAIGLSMDAFAVSISSGSRAQTRLLRSALIIALFFGGFQALMPALGWAAGFGMRNWVEHYDHWIAFILLTVLGGKMFFEALRGGDDEAEGGKTLSLTLSLLLTLSVATSIDALAVGFSFSALKIGILIPVLVIGVVTFIISMAGVMIGHKCGEFFGNKFEFIGGLILIAIGVKILLAHVMPGAHLGIF